MIRTPICDYCGLETQNPVTHPDLKGMVFCTKTCCNKKWKELHHDK